MWQFPESGFTIIETMIFLAISGVLFISAFVLISSYQAKTEFSQGIRQIETDLQAEISHVASGYYPSAGNFICMPSKDDVFGPPDISAGASSRGDNYGCDFIGEAIQFAPSGNNGEYIVYPIVGAEYSDLNHTLVTSLSQAFPTALDISGVNDSQTVSLPYGITVGSVSFNNGSYSGAPGMVGIFSTNGLTNTSQGGSVAASGGNSITLIPYLNDNLNESQNTAIAAINSLIPSAASAYPNSSAYNNPVAYCFNSASTFQSGTITIGTGGNPTSLNLTIQSQPCP
jgi:type II secretory pathway pseudopilin PulG